MLKGKRMTTEYEKIIEQRGNQEYPKCYFCRKLVDKQKDYFNCDHWECGECSMKYPTGEYGTASSSDHM